MILRVATLFAMAAGGTMLSAQGGQLLPSYPKLGFGASVTPAYDGWSDNKDGTRTFLVGYYNRNWDQEVDIPIGSNNHFEPGDPDRGQPTHFLPNRAFGMFTVTVPKNYPINEHLWWVLTINGVTSRVGMILSPDYNITPTKSSEESPNGKYNEPPVLRFSEGGPAIKNPVASLATATTRTAAAGQPMPIDLFVEDDALYATGSGAPRNTIRDYVTALVTKYRGPGAVKVDGFRPFATTKGGKPMEPYAGKASGTVTFSEPGDYVVHVTINDLSGKGGGGSACCWTTAMVKVNVAGANGPRTTGGQQ
jgi:hypothetical protein